MPLALKRQLPLLVLSITALIIMANYFLTVEQKTTSAIVTILQNWSILFAAFALGYGAVNVFYIHGHHISRRTPGQWLYSLWLIVAMCIFAIVGVAFSPNSDQYSWLFNNILFPLGATIYSSLGFFATTACYRALRVRTRETAMIVAIAVIILLRNAPAVDVGVPIIVNIAQWLN